MSASPSPSTTRSAASSSARAARVRPADELERAPRQWPGREAGGDPLQESALAWPELAVADVELGCSVDVVEVDLACVDDLHGLVDVVERVRRRRRRCRRE